MVSFVSTDYLQSNRMFYCLELCKLPPEHCSDFDSQFESRKLQFARASCSVHLISDGKNTLRFSKVFQVLLQYFEDRLANFYVGEPLSNYQDLLDRMKKVYRNIIQGSFFANIYQY